NREYGKAVISVQHPSTLYTNLPNEQVVWMSHGDLVTKQPEGFVVDATSNDCPIAAMSNKERQFYGVQFHPEVRHSEHGLALIENFVFEVCQCEANWTMGNFVEVQVEKIRQQVGNKNVLCALSGGVDSSVVAALIHKAIGSQLTCMFVDNGLIRKGEAEGVMETFGDNFHMKV